MELRHLSTFVAIVESGTLTAASSVLFKTQGAVSNDLRALESHLGVRLLDRSGQKVELTDAGKALLPHAYTVLRRAANLEATASLVRRGEHDVVRIGAVPSLAACLPPLLSRFRQEQPGVRFQLVTGLMPATLDRVLQGSIDLALAHPTLDLELVVRDLGAEEVFVLMRSDDELADRTEVGPHDLVGHPFIGFVRELQGATVAERFFAPVGLYPDPIIEVDDFRVLKRLVRDEHAIALVPCSALLAQEPAEQLSVLALTAVRPAPRMYRPVALLHTDRPMHPQALAFGEFLQAEWVTPALEDA